MKLHDLQPVLGSKKKRKRIGRGHGSGHGKTSTRGQKGQGARSGGGKGPYFEGGQLPLVRRLPFVRGVGFTNIWRVEFAPVNISRLNDCFNDNEEVSPETLAQAGVRHGEYEGLAEKLAQPEWKPDFGPAEFRPRTGAIAITQQVISRQPAAYTRNSMATSPDSAQTPNPHPAAAAIQVLTSELSENKRPLLRSA